MFIAHELPCWPAFPGGSDGEESACSVGDLGLIPGSGRPPGGGMTNPSSILAWRIPWTEEPGWLQCMRSQRIGRDWATSTLNLLNLCHTPLGEELALREASSHFQGHTGLIGQVCMTPTWHPTPVLLPGKSHGRRILVGCSPWGR